MELPLFGNRLEFYPGQIVTVASHSGIGKTALMQSLFLESKENIAYLNIGMPKTAFNDRLHSIVFEFPVKESSSDWKAYEPLINAKLSEIMEGKNTKHTPLIDDVGIFNYIKEMKTEKGISVFIVDYLNLVESSKKHQNRYEEISYIFRIIKQAALLYDVTIFVLAGLNRTASMENSKYHEPEIMHLRDSGTIADDSDIVILLYRAEYYGFDKFPDNESSNGKIEIKVAKNTNGERICFRLGFREDIPRVYPKDVETKLNDGDFDATSAYLSDEDLEFVN